MRPFWDQGYEGYPDVMPDTDFGSDKVKEKELLGLSASVSRDTPLSSLSQAAYSSRPKQDRLPMCRERQEKALCLFGKACLCDTTQPKTPARIHSDLAQIVYRFA
jgi:hypothetical protein